MTPQPEKRPTRRGTHALYWLVSLTLAAALLYWSLRGIQWARVGNSLANAEWIYVAGATVLITVTLFLRAMRWRVLLSAEGSVDVRSAFMATSAGYFGNSFLPARAGELVRTMMISASSGLSRTFILTTALAERLVDAIVLVTVSACVLLIIPAGPSWLAAAAKPFAVVAFVGAAAITVLPLLPALWERILRKLPISQNLQERLIAILGNILHGLRSFHHGRRLFAFLGYTGVIWFLDAVTTVLGARSLGLSIALPVAFLLITGLGLGSALPSTPGYVGVYQFVAISVLTPFGILRDDALAYIVLFQVIQYVVYGIFGLLALWRAGNPLRAAMRSRT